MHNYNQLKILYLIDYIIKKNGKALIVKKDDNIEESMIKLNNDNKEEKIKWYFLLYYINN